MRTNDESKALLESWARRAGLDEAQIRTLVGNPENLEEIRTSLARHDEMSSAMDTARNAETAAKQRMTELQGWYDQTANPAYQEALRVKQVNERYRQQFGDLEDVATPANGVPPRNANGQFVSRNDLNTMAQTGVHVAKNLAYITSDYNYRFGSKYGPLTPAQLDEYETFAVSRGLPPLDAYQQWIAPKVAKLAEEEAERQKADIDARIKAARDEGFRDGQTRRQWGGETAKTTDAFGRSLDAMKRDKESPEESENAGRNSFLEEWEKWNQPEATR